MVLEKKASEKTKKEKSNYKVDRLDPLYTLRNDIIKRRCGLSQLKLNDEAVREVLFGLLNRSIGEHHATKEVVKKYSRHLRQTESSARAKTTTKLQQYNNN